jgi:hypothetical protein
VLQHRAQTRYGERESGLAATWNYGTGVSYQLSYYSPHLLRYITIGELTLVVSIKELQGPLTNGHAIPPMALIIGE